MTDNSTQYKCKCGHYKTDTDGTIFIITDQKKFLANIYNRYRRIKVETVLEAIEVLKKTTSQESAISILKTYVAKSVGLVTENTEEARDLYAKSFRRGNPRNKSKVGL